MSMLSSDAVEHIVQEVHTQYDKCKFKPSNDYQYTVLAAFVLESIAVTESVLSDSICPFSKLKVVSMGTGVKCLPTDKYPVRGDTLHDSHAEVLARRSLVRWLYEEVRRTTLTTIASAWLCRQSNGKWALRSDVKLYLYISTVPCGDASTRFLAATQDPTIAALKDSAPPAAPAPGSAARGRDNYHLHGVLRTKPGRADAPPTRCMSCSDKLAAWNVLGVQGALASRLFHPVYVDSVIIGDVPAGMERVVREDCERALFGRLEGVDGGDLPDGYHLARPSIYFTPTNFKHSRLALQSSFPDRPPPPSSNESLCWFANSPSGQEVIINGSRRGIGAKHRSLEMYRPRVCKLQLFRLHQETLQAVGKPLVSPDMTYFQAKQTYSLYQAAREALKGPKGPFAGWVASGEQWESFNVEGEVMSPPAIDAS